MSLYDNHTHTLRNFAKVLNLPNETEIAHSEVSFNNFLNYGG